MVEKNESISDTDPILRCIQNMKKPGVISVDDLIHDVKIEEEKQ